jgi:cytochrome c oxidase assembly protein subunit 11
MTQDAPKAAGRDAGSANKRLAAGLLLLTAVMVGLSFAAVPLYKLFCQVTGYAGTTQRADAAPTTVLDREILLRFDATVSTDLPWTFHPVQHTMRLKIGENSLGFYKAANNSSAPVTGTATFNVTPEIAGAYFNKIECFCFTEQTLQPGQSVDMPVSFFIDPAIADDPDAKDLREITLSYTFFKINKPDAAPAASPVKGAASKPFEKASPPG